jgi:hypothetical protein
MTKHAKNPDHLPLVESPDMATAPIPLPVLGTFARIE